MQVSFNGNLLTFRLESEDDLLEVAEFIQKRRKPVEPQKAPRVKQKVLSKGTGARDLDKCEAILRKAHLPTKWHEANVTDLIQKEMGISHSSVGNYLHDLVRLGRLYKEISRHGCYSLDAPKATRVNKSDYRLFLQCQKPEIMVDVLRVVKSLSDKLALVVQDDGVYSALNDGVGHMALHVKLSKSFFEEYKINHPLQFNIDSAIALERVQRLKDSVRLAMKESSDTLSIGQFDVKLDSLASLDKPFEHRQDDDFKSELTISRIELEKILSDNKVNSDYIDIVATPNGLVLQSKNDKGDYSKEIIENYQCKEPTSFRLHYLEYLIKCLKASKCETIRLRNHGIFLVTEFVSDPSIAVSLYLTCKAIPEETKVAM